MHPETKIPTHYSERRCQSISTDDNSIYLASRMGKSPEVKVSTARLLKKQKGKCNHCSLTFKPGDKIECDHVVPRQAGGNKLKDNL